MKGKFAKLYDNIEEKNDKIKTNIYKNYTRETCHTGNCLVSEGESGTKEAKAKL